MGKKKLPAAPVDDARARVVERPGGFYWQSEDRKEEYGPFPTLKEAVAAMNTAEESAYEPGESLEEAEEEIGMSNWIDPDTGQPAEDSVPRIEDH
jgi:hypothetical protein